MVANVLNHVQHLGSTFIHMIRTRISRWTKPATVSLVAGMISDVARSKQELMVENALLRQQLIVLGRTVKRPVFTNMDRALVVLLARKSRSWKDSVLIIKPETVLRWHRQGFRLFWKRTSHA